MGHSNLTHRESHFFKKVAELPPTKTNTETQLYIPQGYFLIGSCTNPNRLRNIKHIETILCIHYFLLVNHVFAKAKLYKSMKYMFNFHRLLGNYQISNTFLIVTLDIYVVDQPRVRALRLQLGCLSSFF